MREELAEENVRRLSRRDKSPIGNAWSTRRTNAAHERDQQLPLEPAAVDAAFEQDGAAPTAVSGSRRDIPREASSAQAETTADIIRRLAQQLAQIDTQREQIQQLLSSVQGKR